MSRGRHLQVGDDALTDYNGPGPLARVTIVERDDTRLHGHSQSWIKFRVTPSLRNGNSSTWYDADWLEPVPNAKTIDAEANTLEPIDDDHADNWNADDSET